MIIVEIIKFYSEIGSNIFKYQYLLGRPILDFLYLISNNLFNFLLFLAITISAIYFIMSIYAVINRKKQAEVEFIAEKAPFVTIQIPTYNELVAIRCAKKCLEFDYPEEKFEIIIGDDSNNPDVSKRIDSFSKKHEKMIVTRRGSNMGYKAGNLNYMLQRSKGEILVIFDSDFIPERDFLKRIIAPFISDGSISGVQARWKSINKNKNLVSLLGSTIIDVFHHTCLPFINKKGSLSFLCGSAEAVRKKDLQELGGWESGSLTEDIEFSLKLLKNGKRIIYLSELECLGEVPYTPKDLYKQQMRWAYGAISSFKKHFTTLFLKNENIGFKEKCYISFFCSGFLLSFLLLMLFTTGTISFITHPPGPIDLSRFFGELFRNVALTSGIIISSIFTMAKTKNIKKLASMFAASFSIGLIVTYYVNMGIFKVLFNKPMEWYMLNKKGNLEET